MDDGKPVAHAFFGEPEEALGAATADAASLEELYADLAPRVLRFLRDLLGDAALATDATQETFIRAFRRVHELPEGARLTPWVFGIARRVSLEMRRARGRFRRVIVEAPPAGYADVADHKGRTPESHLLDREALAVVDRALDTLGEERKTVLLLRLDHSLAYEDIAGLMGWSLAKVKVEIFRGREALRQAFETYRGGVP